MKQRRPLAPSRGGGVSLLPWTLPAGWNRSPTRRTGSARGTWPSGPTTSAARPAAAASHATP
eukprot:3080965-Alexandrium_andersonii.AAC.1